MFKINLKGKLVNPDFPEIPELLNTPAFISGFFSANWSTDKLPTDPS
jgi:hypothetical protein